MHDPSTDLVPAADYSSDHETDVGQQARLHPHAGPRELGASGALAEWDRTSDLGRIEVPTNRKELRLDPTDTTLSPLCRIVLRTSQIDNRSEGITMQEASHVTSFVVARRDRPARSFRSTLHAVHRMWSRSLSQDTVEAALTYGRKMFVRGPRSSRSAARRWPSTPRAAST